MFILCISPSLVTRSKELMGESVGKFSVGAIRLHPIESVPRTARSQLLQTLSCQASACPVPGMCQSALQAIPAIHRTDQRLHGDTRAHRAPTCAPSGKSSEKVSTFLGRTFRDLAWLRAACHEIVIWWAVGRQPRATGGLRPCAVWTESG